jgi:hypothetical protein
MSIMPSPTLDPGKTKFDQYSRLSYTQVAQYLLCSSEDRIEFLSPLELLYCLSETVQISYEARVQIVKPTQSWSILDLQRY